jgi:hypothetical protein
MDEDFSDAEEDILQEVSELFSVGQFDILRPNYTSSTSASTTMQSGLDMQVQPTSSVQVQDKIPGAEYFMLGIPHSLIQNGDIIVPDASLSLVPMTVVNADLGSDAVAIKTGIVGAIYDGQTAKFTNVLFDYLKMTKEGAAPEPYMVESLPVRASAAIIYTRAGVEIGNMLFDTVESMFFEILNVWDTSHFQVLTLREDRR